jgi:hypothetical protein
MYYKTRSLFTDRDRQFIAETLAPSTLEQNELLTLSSDPSSVTDLLHERKLFERSMSTPPLLLSISPQLFFYVFVYQALDRRSIADDDVVDYVAGICVEFRWNETLWQSVAGSSAGKTIYVVDLLNLLSEVDRSQQYHLRRYIGNVALFLTGFFPDFIYQRNKQKSAPPIQYYEQIGRQQYETAATESLAFDEDAAPVLNVLADRFVDVRAAINVYTDAYLHLNRKRGSLDVIERQIATLDEEGLRQSLEI